MSAKNQHGIEGFGERLDKLISSHFRSSAEFAKKIGVDRSQVRRWLDGENIPRAEILLMIAKELNCDCHYLLTGARSEYADINRVTGLTDHAINTISKLKLMEGRYAPVCDLKTSEILSIALSDECFVSALADYLSCPDIDVVANGYITNQPTTLIKGVQAFGENTYYAEVNMSVPLKSALHIELENSLELVRTTVEAEMNKKLMSMSLCEESGAFKGEGYKYCFHKKFRLKEMDNDGE